MKVYGCGFNGESQLLCGPSIICCLVRINNTEETLSSVITTSCIFWKTASSWFVSGCSSKEKLIKNVLPSWKLAVSENCAAALSSDGILMAYKDEAWTKLPIQIEFFSSDISPVEHEEHKELKFNTIAIEDNSFLSVSEDGHIYSYGIPVPFGGVKIKEVAVGKEHNLAVSYNGVVYSWGSGMRGQLGNDNISVCHNPEVVHKLQGIFIRDISCGGWHCIALSDSHDAYVWGWNEKGQLGFSIPVAHINTDIQDYTCRCVLACNYSEVLKKDADSDFAFSSMVRNYLESWEPITVISSPVLYRFWSEDVNIFKVSCGDRHTIFLLDDATAWTVGWNKYGQLGIGNTKTHCYPCKVVDGVGDIFAGGWSSLFFCE